MKQKCFLGSFHPLPGLPMSKDTSVRVEDAMKAVTMTSAPHCRRVEIYSHLLTASVPDTSQLDC